MKILVDLDDLSLDVLFVMHKAKLVSDNQLKSQLNRRGIAAIDIILMIRSNK